MTRVHEVSVEIDPEQEPDVWQDPVDGSIVFELDDRTKVYATLEQADDLRDKLDCLLADIAVAVAEQKSSDDAEIRELTGGV